MMDAVKPPEPDSVLVVLQDPLEEVWHFGDFWGVIRIGSDKEHTGFRGILTLVRDSRCPKQPLQFHGWVKPIFRFGYQVPRPWWRHCRNAGAHAYARRHPFAKAEVSLTSANVSSLQ